MLDFCAQQGPLAKLSDIFLWLVFFLGVPAKIARVAWAHKGHPANLSISFFIKIDLTLVFNLTNSGFLKFC